jgi:WD40 repeat protein/serine/threonine protein kinase/tetratricopeptide (TPR) repeat protein
MFDMASTGSERDVLLNQLVDEFVARYRRGERPSLQEYIDRCPDLAAEIRDLFPALVEMELAKVDHRHAEARPAVSPPLAVEQLGDFRILREVGRGGMGVVYEAEQISLGRHVALKVLPAHALLDPRHLQRFRREAKAAARLHHTNIVPVFGVGEQDGLHYYVMQFIKGLGLDVVLDELRGLRQPRGKEAPAQGNALGRTADSPQDASAVAVARGLLSGEFRPPEPATVPEAGLGEASPVASAPEKLAASSSVRATDTSTTIRLPGQTEASTLSESGNQYWQSVARIGMQVADALAHAANQGILHRDIKPSNLLLDETGNVWVTDFGLAKAETDGDNLTHTGDIVGTLRYMAPERFNGQGDLRSDVYSLGLTLYELLLLRPAFDESDRNRLVRQVMHDEPVRPRKINPRVPRDLETVVLKAIARDPAQRYQTPAAMADDLKRFVEDRPVKARRISNAEKFWRWCRRNPVIAGLLTALVVGFWIGFALVTFHYWKAETARQNEARERHAAEDARQREAEQREQAEKTLYYSNIARARLEWQANNGDDAELILDNCPADRRGWEWHFLKQLCHKELFALDGHSQGGVRSVAYSPDGRFIASAGGGNPFYITQGPGSIQPGEVVLWNAATRERVRALQAHKHLVKSVAFSPDSQWLVSTSLDQTAKIWEVATGAELRTLPVHGEPADPEASTSATFSPDGKQLATSGGKRIDLWDVTRDGRKPPAPRLTLRGHQLPLLSAVVFRPDGRQLAAIARRGAECEVKVWDLTAGAEALPLEANRAGAFHEAAFSPDGRYLAAGEEGILKLWDTATGRLLQSIGGHNGKLWGVAFSPDSRQLASAAADGTVHVWNVPRGEEVVHFRGHRGQVRSVAFSPDGQRLVTGSDDGGVKVWDLTVHPEYGSMHMVVEPEAVAFAENGAHLVIAPRGGRLLTIDSDTSALVGGASRVALTSKWMTPAEPACLYGDARWLAGVSQEDPTVAKCWEVRTGQERLVLRGHTLPVWLVTTSPSGQRIATSGRVPRGQVPQAEVKVWDGAEGRPLWELAEPGLSVARLALSPDGDRLALTGLKVTPMPGEQKPRSEAVVRVYAIDGGQVIHSFSEGEDPFLGLAFSPDGTRLAAAGTWSLVRPEQARMVLLWDLTSDRRTISHQGPDWGMDVTFSPDGRRLAVASRLMIKILDAASGEEVLILRGYAHAHPDNNGFNPRVRFSPDGKRIAAICHDYNWPVSVWSVEDETARDPAARLRAAQRRAIGVHLEVAADSYRKDKDHAVFLFHLKCLEGVPALEAPQYVKRGKLYVWNGQWDKAEADFARASELAPDSAALHFECGELYAEHGKWDMATGHCARAHALDPRDDLLSCTSACLHWQIGDREGHRRLSREMLDRFGQTGDPLIALRVARNCLLTPDLADEAKRVMQLADRTVSGTEAHSEYGLFLQTKGLAEYRAGRYEQAVDWLRKSQPHLGDRICGKSVTTFFLAMAYYQLGRADEARAALAQAHKWVEQDLGTLDTIVVSGAWHARFICQIVSREAEALINGKADGPKK